MGWWEWVGGGDELKSDYIMYSTQKTALFLEVCKTETKKKRQADSNLWDIFKGTIAQATLIIYFFTVSKPSCRNDVTIRLVSII